MCAGFHRAEARDETHAVTRSDLAMLLSDTVFLRPALFASLLLAISFGSINGMMNANLRTDVLLNVTRIASYEAVNTTLDEDLSPCTTSSLKNCKLINSGTWYIEAKNSVHGKLLNYSYFIDNGDIVSCKELRDGDVSEDHGLPCAYYVGLSISIGCLLSAAVILIHASLDVSVTHDSLMGLFCSWFMFIFSLMQEIIFKGKVKDFSGNIVEDESIYYHAFPSLLHFYLLALVGWMSVFSQRHFLVTKKSGTAVSTCGHVWDVIVRWAPYCAYFPTFFFINWLLSYFIPLFPYGIMPACDESCWLRQNTVLFSFAAPVAVFALFNMNGGVMLKYREQYLEDPHLKESYVIFSKLFNWMVIVWFFGVLVNCVESFDMFRFLFDIITVCEGIVCPAVVLYCYGYSSRN